MPQDVRRYPLGLQRWASLTSDAYIFGQQRLDAVGAKPTSVDIRKQCLCSPPCWFLEPRPKGSTSVRGQRCASFFPPLADASNMGTVTEMNGIPVEADQLGETQACLGREQLGLTLR